MFIYIKYLLIFCDMKEKKGAFIGCIECISDVLKTNIV